MIFRKWIRTRLMRKKSGTGHRAGAQKIQSRARRLRTSKRRLNSLFLRNNSLILKISSLLTCVGNCLRSGCCTAVSCSDIGSNTLKIAKFPVKFPVSREFVWRRVRSALRRQPALANEFRHFSSQADFHSEWRQTGHSESMLPFGSPADVRGVSSSLTASVLQSAWHIRHNFEECGGPIMLGPDRR